jgi:hypothetical protein
MRQPGSNVMQGNKKDLLCNPTGGADQALGSFCILHWLTRTTPQDADRAVLLRPSCKSRRGCLCRPAGVVDLEILEPSKPRKSHNRSMAMYEEVPCSAAASRIVRTMSICSSRLKTIRCETSRGATIASFRCTFVFFVFCFCPTTLWQTGLDWHMAYG